MSRVVCGSVVVLLWFLGGDVNHYNIHNKSLYIYVVVRGRGRWGRVRRGRDVRHGCLCVRCVRCVMYVSFMRDCDGLRPERLWVGYGECASMGINVCREHVSFPLSFLLTPPLRFISLPFSPFSYCFTLPLLPFRFLSLTPPLPPFLPFTPPPSLLSLPPFPPPLPLSFPPLALHLVSAGKDDPRSLTFRIRCRTRL